MTTGVGSGEEGHDELHDGESMTGGLATTAGVGSSFRLTEAFRLRRLEKPPRLIQNACHGKVFCGNEGRML